MKGSHASQIAHALLQGTPITEAWLNQRHIRSQNKRNSAVGKQIRFQIYGFYDDDDYQYPIKNIGAIHGTDTKLKSGKVTRCGVYVLPRKYVPALKKAIARMGW
jgi:hypothetical protein